MIGLSPLLDKGSGIPVYKQLYQYIRRQIELGRLRENDRLPSIRRLSAHLAISKTTVETAYEQLLAEGYVQSKPRSGLLVLPPPVHLVSSEKEQTSYLLLQAKESAEGDAIEADEAPAAVIDFQYGDVALEKFPLAAWRKCLTEALAGNRRHTLGYGALQGSEELRLEIARYLYAARGISCSPEQIFLAGGTQQAVSLLCQLLLSAEEPFGMEDPGYDGVRTVLSNHRMPLVPIPVDADGLDVEALRRSGAKAVYVTPAHQFPLGSVMPVGKRSRLLQWADETDGIILEDDYNSEFRYQGQPIPPLKAMDAGDRVVYLGTFSKSFLPAARLSYLVLPARLSDGFRERLGTGQHRCGSVEFRSPWRALRSHARRRIVRLLYGGMDGEAGGNLTVHTPSDGRGHCPREGNSGSEFVARSLERAVSGGDYAGDTLRFVAPISPLRGERPQTWTNHPSEPGSARCSSCRHARRRWPRALRRASRHSCRRLRE